MPRADGSRSRCGDDDPGDDVTFLLAANPGEPALPAGQGRVRAASWPARCWPCASCSAAAAEPAARWCSTRSTPASAARRRWPSAGRWPPWPAPHQVLVVTHLPQVAAFADAQVAVQGRGEGRTVAARPPLDDDERVVELSRMLSGQPDSAHRPGPRRGAAGRRPGARSALMARCGGHRSRARGDVGRAAPGSAGAQGPHQAARGPARSR